MYPSVRAADTWLLSETDSFRATAWQISSRPIDRPVGPEKGRTPGSWRGDPDCIIDTCTVLSEYPIIGLLWRFVYPFSGVLSYCFIVKAVLMAIFSSGPMMNGCLTGFFMADVVYKTIYLHVYHYQQHLTIICWTMGYFFMLIFGTSSTQSHKTAATSVNQDVDTTMGNTWTLKYSASQGH